MGGVSLRLCACEYRHNRRNLTSRTFRCGPSPGQMGVPLRGKGRSDRRYRPRRWMCDSSRRWSLSPTTARSRRRPVRCSPCSPTSPATSPGWRRSSASRSSTVPRAASPTTACAWSSGPAACCASSTTSPPTWRASTVTSPATSASACSAPPPAGCCPACSPRPPSIHPNVHAIVAEGSTSVLIPALLAGQYNAAVVHLPIDEPELVIEPLFAEDLLLLTGPDHELGSYTEIPLAELATHRLLLPPPGSALRRVLDRAARSQGVQLVAQAEIDGVRLLATLAVDGFGAAIVPATGGAPDRRPALPRRARARAAAAGGGPRLPPPAAAERRDTGADHRAAQLPARQGARATGRASGVGRVPAARWSLRRSGQPSRTDRHPTTYRGAWIASARSCSVPPPSRW